MVHTATHVLSSSAAAAARAAPPVVFAIFCDEIQSWLISKVALPGPNEKHCCAPGRNTDIVQALFDRQWLLHAAKVVIPPTGPSCKVARR